MSYDAQISEPERERPFQFTLWHAALWFLAICFVLAMVSQWGFWGIVACLVVAAILVLCYGTYWGEWKLASVAATLLMLLACAGVIDDRAERTGPRRLLCQHNLKQVGLALHNYHDDYGCFPPAYIADETGRPMHSWRVLLLPYLDRDGLHSLYDFSEPWDGPRNRRLAQLIPDVYRCADVPSGTTTTTAFLALTGPGTMWQPNGDIHRDDLLDGPQQTLAIVEVENGGICWLEPRDITIPAQPLAADSRQSHGFVCPHRMKNGRRGTWGLFADGSLQFLGIELTVEQLRAMVTIDGGEKTPLP